MITIKNPADGTLLAEVTEDSKEDILLRYETAKGAQLLWKRTPVKDRVDCIRNFSALLETNKEELAATLTQEMGKPLQQARNEIAGARNRIAFFLENSEKHLADEWITTGGATQEQISYEPLGVIANISAWNYPYLVGINVFVPALIGGNAVLYKPSEITLLTGLHIARLMQEAGIPEGVFQVIAGSGAAGEALTRLPLNGYFFTGSFATGQKIAAATAARMVPVQLELGGKDPLYIMDDVADLKKAAADALEGVMYNAGQSCCAVERIYVNQKIYDAFVEEMVKAAAEIRCGNPMEPDMDLGPVSRPGQIEILQEQVADALAKGARLIYQSPDIPEKGSYFPLTLLADTQHNMKLMQEESFGPVIGIQRVADDEEAVFLMNDTPYGLTAAVFGTDYDRAEKIMEAMNTGTVYFNCCDRVSATLPWSGRGHSGVGSTLSWSGIRAFVQPKAWHLRK